MKMRCLFASVLFAGLLFIARADKLESAIAEFDGNSRGVQSNINPFDSKVDGSNEYSSSMVRLMAGKNGEQVMEAGIHVFPAMYKDSKPRFYARWTSDGFKSTGCFNLECEGFVSQTTGILGGVADPISTRNDKNNQFAINVLIFQGTKTKDWILQINNQTIGFWPASLLTSFANGASTTQWGAEVVNSEPNNEHTSTEMGSGEFAKGGFGKAAYHRNLRIVDDNNTLIQPDGVITKSNAPECYSISKLQTAAAPFNLHFFYGGPGKSSSCK